MNETQTPPTRTPEPQTPGNQTPETQSIAKQRSLADRILLYSVVGSLLVNLGWLALVSNSNLFGGGGVADLTPKLVKLVKPPIPQKPKPKKPKPPPPPPSKPKIADRNEPAIIGSFSDISMPEFDVTTLNSPSVTVTWEVDERGRTSSIKFRPTGNSDVDSAIRNAVQGFRFKPAAHNGEAEAAHMEHTFQLGN